MGFIDVNRAKEMLGITDERTVKNWLEGGSFPGAIQTEDGSWLFDRAQVEAVRTSIEITQERNARGDITPLYLDDDDEEPPAL
jgi:hypothetical protein